MSHTEHHAPAPAPRVHYPFFANAAFWTGVASIFLCVVIPRFAPIGFLLAILTIPLALIGYAQAARSDRLGRIATPGLLCALVTIFVWLIARDDWPHIMGGDATWPGWIKPEE